MTTGVTEQELRDKHQESSEMKRSSGDNRSQDLDFIESQVWPTQSTQRFGVSFRNLSVLGRTSEDRFFNDFLSAPIAFVRPLFRPLGVKTTILDGINGLIRKGEMLLVLGRPGSGCSTLLKTLALETQGLYLSPQSVLNYEGTEGPYINFDRAC